MTKGSRLMICPRCGFPDTSEPCALCGQTDFVGLEVGRYDGRGGMRFEITVVFDDPPADATLWNSIRTDLPHRMLERRKPLHYVFFRDGSYDRLFELIHQVRHSKGWELLVNGRPRPFIEELWLPLLRILALPKV